MFFARYPLRYLALVFPAMRYDMKSREEHGGQTAVNEDMLMICKFACRRLHLTASTIEGEEGLHSINVPQLTMLDSARRHLRINRDERMQTIEKIRRLEDLRIINTIQCCNYAHLVEQVQIM